MKPPEEPTGGQAPDEPAETQGSNEPTQPQRRHREPRLRAADGPTGSTHGSGQRTSNGPDSLREREKALKAALQRYDVEATEVCRLAYWATLSDNERDGQETDYLLGVKYEHPARAVVKRNLGGAHARLAVYRYCGCGVFMGPVGHFHWILNRRAIEFDFSSAHRLIYEIDAFVERAKDWWQHELPVGAEADDDQATNDRRSSRFSLIKRGTSRGASTSTARPPSDRVETQSRARSREERCPALEPHLARAYMLMTGVMATIEHENQRVRTLPPDSNTREEPAGQFNDSVELYRAELTRAEDLLEQAGQRYAASRYGLGMLWGVALIALVSLALGGVFAWQGIPAWYAIALPAGALGALVSVLMRMTSGKLTLDVDAGSKMLVMYGVFRPLVGATFGMALFALIKGGLLPGLDIVGEHSPLAFWASVGFIAGFNERFAQDTLASALMQKTASPSPVP